MARDNVTFRFNIDMTQMTVKGRQAIKILEDLELKAGKAGAGMTRMGASASKAGQQTAASAVNFQTATQGMLNLSTAAVQTFTSISNLDRANNRAKMSIIAVARAEDLLNNKRQRLQDMTEAGITSGGKYANMQREIATATADLTVKQEKQAIEQAAVNDIYMLFATNIANVTISSLQTITVLFGQDKMARLGSAAATKLMTFATWDNVRANRAAAFSMTGLKVGLGGTKIGFSLSTVAVRLHTAALNGLKIALGPIGLIFIGISAAMVAYETNLGGVKDTINELLGVKDPFEESLKKERALTQGLTEDNNALTGSFKKLIPVHEQYIKMMRDAAVNRGDSRLAASYQAQLQQPARQGNFSSGVGSPSFSGSGGTSYGGVSSGAVSSGGIIPSAYGATTNINSQINQNIPTSPTTVISNDPPDPMGSIMQQEMFKLLTPPEQMETLIQLSISEGLKGRKGSSEEYMRKAESMRYAAESWRPRGIETDPVKAFNEIANKNTSMKATDWNKRYFPTGMSSSLKYGGDQGDGSGLAFYLQGRDKFDRNIGRETFFAGVGGNLMAMTQNKGGTFGIGNRMLGTSEGNMIEALRQAQMATIDPNATRNTNLATHTMAQFNAMNAGGNVSDMSRFRGQVRPSQTLEILRRNAKTLADNKLRNQIIDRNTNALRFGGTRVPGMEMWEEGAVRGGYSSRQAYSRAALQKRSDSWKQSQIFADYFSGIGRVSSYTGMSDLRGQLGNIHARATDVKETMSMAGLSYKTFNARTGLPYRHSAQQYYQFMRDWNEVRSFNDNELARARQINLLHYEYGIGTFKGSSMPLSALQDRVSVEDQKMQTLGLTRSEAIAIVGTEGRGRTEIDDRLRFSDTLEAISSGTSPL